LLPRSADTQDDNLFPPDREKDSIAVPPAAIKQLTHSNGTERFSGANGQRSGIFRNESIATSSPLNLRKPVSPAYSARSQLKISRASSLALADVLTRKAILYAQFFEELLNWTSAPGIHVLPRFHDGLHGVVILSLICRQIIG
jgi:hypothetical protein